MPTDRESIRKQLSSILTAALVGTSKPVEEVFAYQPATFNGKSPVVTVSSAGTLWSPMTHQGQRSTHVMYIHVFVLYADVDSGWTESQAEDRLDLIQKTIATTITSNRVSSGYWDNMHQDEPSRAIGVEIGGDEYRLEVITVTIEVYE